MPKKYRYHKPRLSTMSSVPAIYGMRSWVDMMNLMVFDMPKRVDRGRELFLLEVARIMVETIQRHAPEIKINGEMKDYSKNLAIGIVDGDDDMDAVAIWVEGSTLKIDEKNIKGKALYFQATRKSPKWVNVLMVYGPWPSTMVPVPTKDLEAKVISRNAREDELRRLANRINMNKGKIESDFASAGMPNVSIGETSNAIGVVIEEDIGYNILRSEFGYDRKQVSHWRPAFRAVKKMMPILMKKYLAYLKTGNESVFDLTGKIGSIKLNELDKSRKFVRTLAPFFK